MGDFLGLKRLLFFEYELKITKQIALQILFENR